VLFLFCLSAVQAQPQPPKPAIEGTGQAGEHSTKWAVYILSDAAPGEYIVAVEDLIGTIGKGGILNIARLYFAGIEGRTLHLYRIETKDGREQGRYPILLPLAPDNTTAIRVRPIFADRSYTVRLRLSSENLLAGVLNK